MSILKIWAKFQRARSKSNVLNQREMFYEAIAEKFRHPNKNKPSSALGQEDLLSCTKIDGVMLENESGILYIEVGTNYAGFQCQHAYSLYTTGDLFRIGLLLYGGLEKAPLVDWQNEIQTIWPGSAPDQQDRDGLTMYEWTFFLPDLADNYATQERYILGMSHMHHRILRIVRDYRFMQRQEVDITPAG